MNRSTFLVRRGELQGVADESRMIEYSTKCDVFFLSLLFIIEPQGTTECCRQIRNYTTKRVYGSYSEELISTYH